MILYFFVCGISNSRSTHMTIFVSFVGFWMFHLLDYYNCKRSFQPMIGPRSVVIIPGAHGGTQRTCFETPSGWLYQGVSSWVRIRWFYPLPIGRHWKSKKWFSGGWQNTGKLFNGQFSPSHYSSKYAINGSKLRMQLDPPLRMEIHPGTHSDGTQIPQAAHTTTIPTRIPSGTGSDWEASMEMSIWSLVPEDWKTWNR